MKKVILATAVVAFFTACHSDSTSKVKASDSTSVKSDTTTVKKDTTSK